MAQSIKQNLTTRYGLISRTITELEKKLNAYPPDKIVIKHSNGGVQYYLVRNGVDQKYLNSSNKELITQLIQKQYLEKVLKAARAESKVLERAINQYPELVLEDVYDSLIPERKALARPILLSDEEFAKRWLATTYTRKPIKKGTTTFKTLKGDKVRSKSEVIIADRLWANGIPYKYECPLMAGGEIIHPDFTILRMSDRKIVYHEHCGRMDDPGYTEDMVNRNNLYAKEGIYNGDRLFYSFESSTTPLNTEYIDDFINTNFR